MPKRSLSQSSLVRGLCALQSQGLLFSFNIGLFSMNFQR